ncbi:MAG: hypothetical protein AAGC67_19250 [Myxococcota bacterium]
MTRQALADRIVVYSDTVVAFALVNGLAFVISLADPDIRCSIAAVSTFSVAVNAVVPVLGTWTLFWLRRYEARLRAVDEDGDGVPDEPPEDPLVAGFWRRLFVVRLVLIWVFSVIVLSGVYGATQDVACEIGSGARP